MLSIGVEGRGYGASLDEAWHRSCDACGVVHKADWRLATTPPTTLAGVAAVLFANKIEDGGMEWPDTDMIGAEGWHYQMRATMAGWWHYIKVIIPQRRARTVAGWRGRAEQVRRK
jgi:hypothetical protein